MASIPASARPVTIVTGGSRGIGAAIAQRLAENGHDLVITYRTREQEAQDVVARCRERGARVALLQADFGDLERVGRILPDALASFDRVSGLVNNVGVTGRIGGFLDVDPAEEEWVFRVNVLAPLILTRAVIAHMSTARGGEGGAIVNISSGAATSGAPSTYIPYAMSKAALSLFTVGAAREFARDGVRVNTVSPGTTYTEIHADGGRPDAPEERAGRLAMGRAAHPEEIAGAVAYLLSPEASYTSGADIRITGG